MNPQSSSDQVPYDVIVVGAGPAGATAAYYLAHGLEGGPSKRVALLEKATFPRDKYCGDAWCAPALDILEDMDVLQKLEAEGLIQDTTSGGFVSPSGESFVSTGEGGEPVAGTRCYAIKRIICDERIARRAVEVGADLFEDASFSEAKLEDDGFWTVSSEDGRQFRARILVAADGAASQVARSLGVVTTPPAGVASRQYVKGGTHNFKSGGVLLYPSYSLPGYVALFRHYDDDIDVGCYLIPGGAVSPEGLTDLYENEIRHDPFLQMALGPNVEFKERVKVASLRMGGVERSTDRQFLAVGDAAGQTDPLTGEGIHTGMIGGKLAAKTIHEMFENGDFSAEACAVYHKRWMDDFGNDFPASAMGGRMVFRFPFFMDAANVVAQRRGDDFMAEFGAVMTGVKPKTTFLKPSVALPLGVEVVRQLFKQKIFGSSPSEEAGYRERASARDPRETTFRNCALINPEIEVATLPMGDSQADASLALDAMLRFRSDSPSANHLLVLYGTEYGFSREVAARVCTAIANIKNDKGAQHYSLLCLDFADFEILDWAEETTALFICSTAGDGVPPLAARALFEKFDDANLELSHLQFSTLALGDRGYPQFCKAGRDLEAKLLARGATSLTARVNIDQEDLESVDRWIQSACEALQEPKFAASLKDAASQEALIDRAREHFAAKNSDADQVSRANPLRATLLTKRALTVLEETDDLETLHIEIDTSDPDGERTLTWEPGDSLGILPKNCPEEVDASIELLSCTGNESVTLPRNLGETTLRDAMLEALDIKNLSQELLARLRKTCTSEDESQLAETLTDSEARPYLEQRELQDVLRDFESAAKTLDAESLCALLRPMQPRYYSITSSRQTSQEQLGLCVAIVRYELLGRTRTGLATTYLADRVKEGDPLSVFVQRNPDFRMPAKENSKSCVMIGAGTGIAPYRAFLQELESRAPSDEPHLLFFGCRHQDRDFLYREELEKWEGSGLVKLILAFSRDQEEKIYVQDRLREHSELIWKRMQTGHPFYVCGDATAMAVDVRAALLQIIQMHGSMSRDHAEVYLAAMEAEGALQKDVWAT